MPATVLQAPSDFQTLRRPCSYTIDPRILDDSKVLYIQRLGGGEFKRWTNVILSSDLNLKKYLYVD